MPNKAGLKIVFAGTPEFAERHLSALIDSHHEIISVYTQPDRPAGRGKKLKASPVKERALKAGLEIQQPSSLKSVNEQQTFASYHADVMIVVAYGLLLPLPILSTPRLGCINVHGSILPRWRGAAPIQRAIEAGDTETGITIMQMDIGLDTGDMLFKATCSILSDDTASSLHDRLALTGPDALLTTLEQLSNNTTIPQAQDNKLASYAHKLNKQEAELDWSLNASKLDLRIRAFNPFPIATTHLGDERFRVHCASIDTTQTTDKAVPGTILSNSGTIIVACGEETALSIDKLQLPGKKALSSREILNGCANKFSPGTVLGKSILGKIGSNTNE